MRHFHRLCAPGLFRRSLDEFKRFAKIGESLVYCSGLQMTSLTSVRQLLDWRALQSLQSHMYYLISPMPQLLQPAKQCLTPILEAFRLQT
jgi:hypothetical protein